MGLVQLTAAFVPSMVERGEGGVLNIGSGAGLTVMPASAAYSASKHFVDGFSEGLRADLSSAGVAVTTAKPDNRPSAAMDRRMVMASPAVVGARR